MFKVFWANCKSNWKKNLSTNAYMFFLAGIYLNNWRMWVDDRDKEMAVVSTLFWTFVIILLCILPLIDVSVPQTFYMCPFGFEDRKNYIRYVNKLRKCICIGLCVGVSGVIYATQMITEYMLFVYIMLTSNMIFLQDLYMSIPGINNPYQNAGIRLKDLIGRKDSIIRGIYIAGVFILLIFNAEQELELSVMCVIQWIFMIAGPFLVRYMYKKHYDNTLALAADYETCMKYQKPIKK